jgi:hypothetical protein
MITDALTSLGVPAPMYADRSANRAAPIPESVELTSAARRPHGGSGAQKLPAFDAAADEENDLIGR